MTSVVVIGGGPAGYEAALVARQLGAQVVLIERDGIQNGIDWFPMRHGSELRVLETLPAVASATMAWPGRSGDSDIQHDFEPVATELPLSSNSDRPTRSSQPD